jgi:hypothetical protein
MSGFGSRQSPSIRPQWRKPVAVPQRRLGPVSTLWRPFRGDPCNDRKGDSGPSNAPFDRRARTSLPCSRPAILRSLRRIACGGWPILGRSSDASAQDQRTPRLGYRFECLSTILPPRTGRLHPQALDRLGRRQSLLPQRGPTKWLRTGRSTHETPPAFPSFQTRKVPRCSIDSTSSR